MTDLFEGHESELARIATAAVQQKRAGVIAGTASLVTKLLSGSSALAGVAEQAATSGLAALTASSTDTLLRNELAKLEREEDEQRQIERIGTALRQHLQDVLDLHTLHIDPSADDRVLQLMVFIDRRFDAIQQKMDVSQRTERDAQLVELGAAMSLYSVALATIAHTRGKERLTEADRGALALADQTALDLMRQVARSDLPSVQVRTTSSFSDANEVLAYLREQDFARRIADHAHGKGGKRGEAALKLGVKFAEGLAAKRFRVPYEPAMHELVRLGAAIGIEERLISLWARTPGTALDRIRSYFGRTDGQGDPPEAA